MNQKMKRFNSILVANRGEIALRVMRTARSLGYRTIAVYSDVDANAPHVKFADEAVFIGTAPASESYLCVGKILKAAMDTQAGAIHPGYGFLSENAKFAEMCAEAGIVLIGPNAKAIELMGNKAAAKRRMIKAGVPCVPGYEAEDQSYETLIAAAGEIGFPIMVKAAAGGGGRGMRLVQDAPDLPAAISSARSEALAAFGSDQLILEKAILRPRHVEVQVFADAHGNVIHLGERDCSVQRRHQKVIEEAPCPVMTPDLRAAMGKAAVDAARSIDYLGAGTVEFLLDGSGDFYFIEMNTRLQVEHPVTEMITGLDLVALQISVAQGDPLPVGQDDVSVTGHAVEARLYAEDPANAFLPMSGQVDLWQPAQGKGVRIDAGIETGSEVPPFYDPLMAKLIGWGPDRKTAIARLNAALDNSLLFGIPTNKGFLSSILSNETFVRGEATTAFITDEFPDEELRPAHLSARGAMIAAVLQFEEARERSMKAGLGINPELANFSSGGLLETAFQYTRERETFDVCVKTRGDGYEVNCGDETAKITVEFIEPYNARLRVNECTVSVGFMIPKRGTIHLEHDGKTFTLCNTFEIATANEETVGGTNVVAPMHGTLLSIDVSVGDKVTRGSKLAVLEAMKMQHAITAEIDGTVVKTCVDVGSQIAGNDLILVIEPSEENNV